MLRVNEIFTSISGETGLYPQGTWVTFIRFAGCNLRCKWCDTEWAQGKGAGVIMDSQDILERVQTEGVILTGGEPLTQRATDLQNLCTLLNKKGKRVCVETNGSLDYHGLKEFVDFFVFDYKLPSSGMMSKMLPFKVLLNGCAANRGVIKMVCQDREDYLTARALLTSTGPDQNIVSLSAAPPLEHSQLYQWMKEDGLYNTLLNVQIHKICALKEGGWYII